MPVHEKKLGTVQANTGSARCPYRRHVFGHFNIRQQFNLRAIYRERPGGFNTLQFLLLKFPLLLPQPVLGQNLPGRINDNNTEVAINNNEFAIID